MEAGGRRVTNRTTTHATSVYGRFAWWVAWLLGARRDEATLRLLWPEPRTAIWRMSLVVAALYIIPLFVLQVSWLPKSPQFGPASLTEETAYTYISAGNFLRYGFMNSGFLQDFSS